MPGGATGDKERDSTVRRAHLGMAGNSTQLKQEWPGAEGEGRGWRQAGHFCKSQKSKSQAEEGG